MSTKFVGSSTSDLKVRVSDATREQLETIAQHNGASLSQIVRQAITAGLESPKFATNTGSSAQA